MIALVVIVVYLMMLLALGLASNRLFRGTSADYMLASHTIGPVMLLMSLFGTTMTAFALVGSSGEAYARGIGVYGLMASSSGIVHSLCFFVCGVRLWSFGQRFGYTTQIEFFRDRLESGVIGLLLFPVLVGLVVPYLLIGVISSGIVVSSATRGALPGFFAEYQHGVPPWLGSLVICLVVLLYVFFGGMRGTAWANTFQTTVFIVLGGVTFAVIARELGGLAAASTAVFEQHPEKLSHANLSKFEFLTYLLIPLSVGMFPHVFQHWLTARSASAFKLPIVMHPIFIMIVWLPCVMIGVWATSAFVDGHQLIPDDLPPNAVLAFMVQKLAGPLLGGLLTAGILAAIMSSLDSQFLCLGTMFTKDVVLYYGGQGRLSERNEVLLARGFVVLVVAITYGLSLVSQARVFQLGLWCFSGFAALFPVVLAAIYWRRLTAAGAIAAVLVTIVQWCLLFYQSGYGANAGFRVWGLTPVVPMFVGSAVALVVVSLFTKPPSETTLKKFFPDTARSR